MQSIAERSEQLPKDWQNNKHDNDEVVVVHNLWTHTKKEKRVSSCPGGSHSGVR